MMKTSELIRPDKLILKGLKSLGDLGQQLYANERTESKAKAELTFIGEQKMEEVKSQLFTYDPKELDKQEQLQSFDFIKAPIKGKSYWLNFHGVHDVDIIQKIGAEINLDRLTTRQILDTTQRPKVEEYEQHLFFSVKSILKGKEGNLKVEHLSFILGDHYVISFQEEVGDHFEGIRNKIAEGLGFVRKKKSDYLLSQVLDAILDNYFETIDQLNREIALIEREVIDNPDKSTLILLETQKQSAQVIKKALRPFKEALANIMNGHVSLIKDENLKYFKDLSSSAVAAMEEIDSILNRLEGLTNICFATQSQKMNETMKVLTTVATIFIPLTFIAGIYGMNFENMPELRNPNGYFYTWGVMGFIFFGMVIYFKVKKWI